MRDHWNLLDVLALAFCLAAFLVRVFYPSNHWGRALYSFGAPLLLFRALFFAQFLPAQGPMIEVSWSQQNICRESMYVCMYGHTYSKSMDQPGKVANPARGQLNKENEYFPVRVRA